MTRRRIVFTTGDLMRRLGVTARQIQYWDEDGLLHPSNYTDRASTRKRGFSPRLGPREYTPDEALEMGLLAALRARRMYGRKLRDTLADLRKLAREEKSRYFIVTPAGRAAGCDTAEETLAVFAQIRAPGFLIDFDEVRRRVAGERTKRG